MTETLYQNDSYIKEFEANIIDINEEQHAVLLDRTAFYPGGGGQAADNGILIVNGTSIPIKRAKKGPEGIWHYLEKEVDLPTSKGPVSGQINWERRYLMMRTHTAMHVLCGVIFRDYGAMVTGGDMDPGKGRMDFEFESLQKEFVALIERSVNEEIAKEHDIFTQILPREEAFQIPDLLRTKINLLPPAIKEIRTVEIRGLDLQADGGTHVHNTKEVGLIRIPNYKSKGKINKRFYLELI
ncbi:MAG: alanyl-tRNA editing protein [Anaerolineaceae bacterium]|nr:alanyl-tRNA editing protein [Anaerolineaceae bacterium]